MCNGYSFSNNGKCSGFDHNLGNLGYNPRIWSLLVARRCKVKVLKFSIGFGRAIKSWRGKDGVEFVIAPIPLGGYVKMLGQEDTKLVQKGDVPVEEEHASFASKSPLREH